MAGFRIDGGTVRLETGSVLDEMVSSSTNIDADKLQHAYKPGTNFDLPIGSTPVAREEIVFVASQAGTIRGFHCLLNDTGTTTDVDFDLKVDGVSVLSAVVNITDADVDRDVQEGTISSASLSAGDVVSISLAVTTSTGAQGPFAWADIEENTAP